MNIKLYRRQGSAPSQQQRTADPMEGQGVGREITKLGATVEKISNQYNENLTQRETAYQTAEYVSERNNMWGVAQGAMNEAESEEEVDQVYQQYLKDEKDAINSRKFTPAARSAVERNNMMFAQEANIAVNGAAGYKNGARNRKLDINAYMMMDEATRGNIGAETVAQFANIDEIPEGESLNQFAYNSAIDDLLSRGSVKPRQAVQMKAEFITKTEYHRLNVDMALLKGRLIDEEITPNEYISGLNSIHNSAEESKMDYAQKQTIKVQSITAVNNIKAKTSKDAEKAINSFSKNVENGTADVSDWNNLRATMGNEYAEYAMRKGAGNAFEQFRVLASGRDDGVKLLNNMRELRLGNISWDVYLKKTENLKGDIGDLSLIASSEYAKDAIKSSGTAAYDVFWGSNQKFPVKSEYDGFVDSLYKNVISMPEKDRKKRNDFVISSMKALQSFQKRMPDATPEQIKQFQEEVLSGNAKELISVKVRGSMLGGYQVIESESMKRIKDAKLDIPEGARLAPDGNYYIKKQDGWYRVK